MQSFIKKYDVILESSINGQRKQALEQLKRLSLAERWECVEYASYSLSDKMAFAIAKLAITKEA